MDLSELAKRYAELGHWVEVDGWWLNWWTAAVVFGVAIELGIIWEEYSTDLKDFRRGTIRSPERPRRIKLIVEMLSAALVVGGVLGELLIARSTGEKETEMRAISGKQLSIAEAEAAEANLKAAKLLAEIQPREISADQKKAIRSRLSPFVGRVFKIASYEGDSEGARFTTEVLRVLKASGLIADQVSISQAPLGGGFGSDSPPGKRLVYGVVVGHGLPKDSSFVNALTGALSPFNAGFKFSDLAYGGMMYPTPAIFVGLKPIPPEAVLPPQ